MLKSLVAENSTRLIRLVNELKLSKDQIVQIVYTQNQLLLFYYE